MVRATSLRDILSLSLFRSCRFSLSLSRCLSSQWKVWLVEGRLRGTPSPSPGVSGEFLGLFSFLHDERKREERAATARRRLRRHLPRRRHSQPLRASARARLDLREAQGQYMFGKDTASVLRSLMGSMIVRSCFGGCHHCHCHCRRHRGKRVCFDRGARESARECFAEKDLRGTLFYAFDETDESGDDDRQYDEI